MCGIYRLKFEDVNLNPIDDYDVFDSKRAAMLDFNEVVTYPPPDLGAVYLLEDRGEVEVVIAGHYFVKADDS